MNNNIPASIFKAYDIRGIVGQTLTKDIVTEIGRAIGSEAQHRGQTKIIVGRDGRLSGPELINALKQGLVETGCHVVDVGMVPTPVVYFAAQHIGSGSCVALTGSHNPPDYNGLKMVIGGVTLSGDEIQNLKQRIVDQDFVSGSGSLEETQILDDYVNRIANDVKLARPLNVVVDCGNGVSGIVAAKLMKALGCEVEELFCEVDGTFPNHHPDPSKPDNLQDLIKSVKASKADIGLAFDGDGDRLGVITPRGDIVWPDRQMMLYAKDILSRNPGAEIIYDIKCTTNLAKTIEQYGGKATMWRTGHSYVKAKLRESGALLAGEMSGHIFFKERWYGFDDATYTAARLLEILSKEVQDIQTVFSSLPDSVNTPELNIHMAEGEHFKFIDKLIDNAHFENCTITTIDGIRVDYNDGFGLIRASNTTPTLVIRFEGRTAEAMKRIQDEFRNLILQVDKTMEIPF